MVEFLLVMPMFVMFVLVTAELSQMYKAKSVVDMAALSAARAGAIANGSKKKMRTAAAVALTPLYTHSASAAGVSAAMANAIVDANLPHAVGSNTVTKTFAGSFNGASAGSLAQRTVKIDILSPTKRMASDFGVKRNYGDESSEKVDVIPNDNLTFRSTKKINNVNVQDANLLKIRLTYLYELKMPLTRYFFTPFMNANLTGVLFGGESAGVVTDLGYRVPLVSYATVRMQSDFKLASLDESDTAIEAHDSKPYVPPVTPTDPSNPTDPSDPNNPSDPSTPNEPTTPGNTDLSGDPTGDDTNGCPGSVSSSSKSS
jgi:hypothetical protein